MRRIFALTLWLLASNAVAQLNLLGLQLDLLGSSNKNKPETFETDSTRTEKPTCRVSRTKLSSSVKVCKGDLIFKDDFDRPLLNKNLWEVEQYMPIAEGPDYEFVSYENNEDTLWIQNGKLVINPIAREEESQIRGTLDLRDGCTSKLETECFLKQISTQIIPPVRSAKISTKFGFTYGRVDIEAKLPVGDWIYPQIQLVPRRKEQLGSKMWIAYARGNNHYIGDRDEGSSLLFGGVVIGSNRQDRTRFTRTRPSLKPYGNNTNTYTLIWEPDLVTLLFNGEEYGKIPIDEEDERFYSFRRECYLTLGIGVGGINDFPDSYTSNSKKPWTNFDRKQMKDFFDARNEWLPSWGHRNSKMLVESVKVYAV